MSDIKDLQDAVAKFCDERDWSQFHNGKDLASAIAIEAAELQEAFLWKTAAEAKPEKIKEELADVFIFALRMAERYGLDVAEIVKSKLALNAAKYPAEKCRGTAKKYTEI